MAPGSLKTGAGSFLATLPGISSNANSFDGGSAGIAFLGGSVTFSTPGRVAGF